MLPPPQKKGSAFQPTTYISVGNPSGFRDPPIWFGSFSMPGKTQLRAIADRQFTEPSELEVQVVGGQTTGEFC